MEQSAKQVLISCLDTLVNEFQFWEVVEYPTRENFRNWCTEVADNDPDDFDFYDDESYYCSIGNFYVRAGATKMVIISEFVDDWVLKIPFVGLRYDYCKREVKVYNSAKAHHCEKFLAPCEKIGKYEDVCDIYAMRRADGGEDEVVSNMWDCYNSTNSMSENEISSKIDELNEYDGFFDELRQFYYSTEENENWEDFIADNEINDIHSGNIGFLDGRAVIIDYSSYMG